MHPGSEFRENDIHGDPIADSDHDSGAGLIVVVVVDRVSNLDRRRLGVDGLRDPIPGDAHTLVWEP